MLEMKSWQKFGGIYVNPAGSVRRKPQVELQSRRGPSLRLGTYDKRQAPYDTFSASTGTLYEHDSSLQ